jgi:cytosine/adenosine deaminase-related metal-dependent hydrolase
LLVEAGFPRLAAVQAATINAARFMGQADRGTIEVGKVVCGQPGAEDKALTDCP